MKTAKDILNFIRGTKEKQFHLVSYHVDEQTDKVVIDWAGTFADAKENSFMSWHGTPRKVDNYELETALNSYLKTHEVKPYDISMAYERMRADHNIK
jgi:hypothetical protein